MSTNERAAASAQWRGVIEEYRDWLPLPEGTPTFTLREGGTPLVDSPWLSELTGAEVWIKVEGSNPTGSLKDPVGLSPSTLIQTSAPVSPESHGLSTRGVPPSRSVWVGVPSGSGNHSRYSSITPRH